MLRARGVSAQPCVRCRWCAHAPRRRGTGCWRRPSRRPALGVGRSALEARQPAAVQRVGKRPACRRAPGPAPAPAFPGAGSTRGERDGKAASSELVVRCRARNTSPHGTTQQRQQRARLGPTTTAHERTPAPPACRYVPRGSTHHTCPPGPAPGPAACRQTRCNSCERRCCVVCGYSRATRCACCLARAPYCHSPPAADCLRAS